MIFLIILEKLKKQMIYWNNIKKLCKLFYIQESFDLRLRYNAKKKVILQFILDKEKLLNLLMNKNYIMKNREEFQKLMI